MKLFQGIEQVLTQPIYSVPIGTRVGHAESIYRQRELPSGYGVDAAGVIHH